MRFDPKIKPEVFCSKDSTRPHLTRVQLDCEAKSLVATDGHRMLVTPIEDAEADHTGPLAPEVLIAARKSAKQHGATLAANGHVNLPSGVTHMRPGDAKDFPPWQNVLSGSLNSEVTARVRLNAAYLASIHAAVGSHGADKGVDIIVRGEHDPVEFRVQGELGETIMLVMPMRR